MDSALSFVSAADNFFRVSWVAGCLDTEPSHSAEELVTASRHFAQRLPEAKNGMTAKDVQDAKGVQIAENGATVGTGEGEENFHGEGSDFQNLGRAGVVS